MGRRDLTVAFRLAVVDSIRYRILLSRGCVKNRQGQWGLTAWGFATGSRVLPNRLTPAPGRHPPLSSAIFHAFSRHQGGFDESENLSSPESLFRAAALERRTLGASQHFFKGHHYRPEQLRRAQGSGEPDQHGDRPGAQNRFQ